MQYLGLFWEYLKSQFDIDCFFLMGKDTKKNILIKIGANPTANSKHARGIQ